MEAQCERIEGIVTTWEGEGYLSSADLEALQDHVASCPTCARRHIALLPLIERDTGKGPVSVLEMPRSDFTEGVMRDIRSAPLGRRSSDVPWIAVAAACFLIFLGGGAIVSWKSTQRPANEVVVRFELALPEARSVSLVGSFTSWDITRLPMVVSRGNGTWQVSVRLTKGLIYTYNFVVDGRRWITDPNASAQVDDGFGGQSSVIRL